MILLQVKQDGFFPADLLFLASTNADGVFYIETANLDGETNLKIRKALEKTWDYLTPEKASEFKGEIQCEQPNNSLYTFTGNLLIQKQTLPLPKPDSFASMPCFFPSLCCLCYHVVALSIIHKLAIIVAFDRLLECFFFGEIVFDIVFSGAISSIDASVLFIGL
ncbi:hypothetical protein RYX36_018345 [Vicia faba]